MLDSCTDGTTVPKTSWSMAAGGISARCTSSDTTCLLSSSAERSLKTVPDLTKGVRKPATMATRRPGRAAMGTSRRSAGHSPRDRSGQRKSSSAFGAQLEQIIPGVDAGGWAVVPVVLHRVAADLVHPARLHVLFHLRIADDALAAPLLDALRAGAARP